jgi:hypothetical protein
MRGIAGRRPKAATINLEEVKSARSITAGNTPIKCEDTKEEGRISLSKALFDEH